MKKLLTIIATLFALAAPAKAGTLKVDPNRTITITGVVAGNILNDTNKLLTFAEASGRPVYIVINSPGGSVLPGLQFITAMQIAKQRGVKIHCVSPVMAASMAFQILVNCDYRYAFGNSLLLWHPMRIAGFMALTSSDLLYAGKEIRALERPLIEDLMKALEISKKTFYYHYRHETMWTARRLKKLSPKFITIIDDIEGVTGFMSLR